MNYLPIEVFSQIFSSFTFEERLRLRLVNKNFKEGIEFGFKIISHVNLGGNISIKTDEKYILKASYAPNIHFFSLINKYCVKSLQLYSIYNINIDLLKPLAFKLRAINCSWLFTPKNTSHLLTKYFPKLQLIRHIHGHDHICCSNLLAKERIKQGKKVIHMSLPCTKDESRRCWSLDDELPSELISLQINFKKIETQRPIIREEVTSSLIELIINGTVEKNTFKGCFALIQKLELSNFDELENGSNLNDLLLKLSEASNLQYLKIDIRLNPQAAELLNKYLNNLINLTELELIVQSSQSILQEINLPSLKLKSLFVSTNMILSLKISSTKLTRVTINAESLIDLKMNFASLQSLNIKRTKISCFLLQCIDTKNQLRFLQIDQCKLTSDVVVDLFNNLKHLKAIESISLSCPKYLIPTDSGSLSLDFTNHQSLKKVTLGLRHPIVINMETKDPVSILYKSDDLVTFTLLLKNTNSVEISMKFVANVTSFKFGDFSSLESFSVEYKSIPKSLKKKSFELNLLQSLEKSAFNVSKVNFSQYCFRLLGKDFYGRRVISWLKSLKNLYSLTGPFSQTDICSILKKYSGSNVNIQVPKFSKTDLTIVKDCFKGKKLPMIKQKIPLFDDVHEVLVKLIDEKNLIDYNLPWKCYKCSQNFNKMCPFSPVKNQKLTNYEQTNVIDDSS